MPRLVPSKQWMCTARLEAHLQRRGWSHIAGCDEVGRGALMGPLVAAAVILDPTRSISGLNDSKKIAPDERERLDAQIRSQAVAYGVAFIEARDVDRLNVYQASRQAMIEAVRGLSPRPDFILTDAMPLPGFPLPHRALIHGDSRSVTIAAASILAKVARDAHMRQLDKSFPGYEISRNKGYGTPQHMAALERLGPCPEHRKSFRPVAEWAPSSPSSLVGSSP